MLRFVHSALGDLNIFANASHLLELKELPSVASLSNLTRAHLILKNIPPSSSPLQAEHFSNADARLHDNPCKLFPNSNTHYCRPLTKRGYARNEALHRRIFRLSHCNAGKYTDPFDRHYAVSHSNSADTLEKQKPYKKPRKMVIKGGVVASTTKEGFGFTSFCAWPLQATQNSYTSQNKQWRA